MLFRSQRLRGAGSPSHPPAIDTRTTERSSQRDVDSGRKLRTLEGHSKVRGVAVNANGKVAVSAFRNNTLVVWNLDSGRELRTLQGHFSRVTGVAVSADGRIATSASEDRTLRVWDVDGGANW